MSLENSGLAIFPRKKIAFQDLHFFYSPLLTLKKSYVVTIWIIVLWGQVLNLSKNFSSSFYALATTLFFSMPYILQIGHVFSMEKERSFPLTKSTCRLSALIALKMNSTFCQKNIVVLGYSFHTKFTHADHRGTFFLLQDLWLIIFHPWKLGISSRVKVSLWAWWDPQYGTELWFFGKW